MNSLMLDLTFLDTIQRLWNKESLDKLDKCLVVFREDGGDDGTEECFINFCSDFAMARNKFINNMKDLSLIMKCRAKADSDSKFGGQQCAEFMKDIQIACDKYINTTIYSRDNNKSLISQVISKVRDVANKDEKYAWDFESKARRTYLEKGIDITTEILKGSDYERI